MHEQTIYTVSDYVSLINETLAILPSEHIAIEGEVSDYRVSQGKWINFDLKDEKEEAKVSCFTTVYQMQTPLEDGMRVQIYGSPKVYPRFGRFSVTVDRVELVGEGALAKAYILLKKRLQEEGLFDVSRKRSLVRFPKRIGLITSSEAAAYGDFLRILNNRWTGVEVMHVPVHVQGQYAVSDILGAFQTFEDLEQKPDVLVLTRGGGSLEDLHAFNDESVARAIFRCSIPVVVGVGHERDESLADFVADVRASTPSNAAEIIVPDRKDVLREVAMHTQRIEDILTGEVRSLERSVDHALHTLQTFMMRRLQDIKLVMERFQYAFERFRLSLVATRQYVEQNERRIATSFEHIFTRSRMQFEGLIRLFETFDVAHTLKRGFVLVRSSTGDVVADASKLGKGELVQLQFAKSARKARIEDDV